MWACCLLSVTNFLLFDRIESDVMLYSRLCGLGWDVAVSVALIFWFIRRRHAVLCKLCIKLGEQVIVVNICGVWERGCVEVEVVVAHRASTTVEMLTLAVSLAHSSSLATHRRMVYCLPFFLPLLLIPAGDDAAWRDVMLFSCAAIIFTHRPCIQCMIIALLSCVALCSIKCTQVRTRAAWPFPAHLQ